MSPIPIVRNVCTGNTATFVASNVFGPIIDRTSPATAAMNGNPAPSGPGSTDVDANFTC